jgi:hypothetical protein
MFALPACPGSSVSQGAARAPFIVGTVTGIRLAGTQAAQPDPLTTRRSFTAPNTTRRSMPTDVEVPGS